MPMIDADGCLLNVSVEGRDGGPTLMLSNSLGSHHADVGAADEGADAAVSRHPLRPARPRQVERAARAPIRWSASAATCWRSSTTSTSRRRTGAACRWAAWSGNGSAPTRPSDSARSSCPTPPAIIPDPTRWNDRIKAVKEGGIAAVADAVMAGWLTADFREREPQIAANMKAMLLATPVEGYHRLLRGAVRRSTSASCCRGSRARRWSSPAATTWRRRSRTANSSAAGFPAPA